MTAIANNFAKIDTSEGICLRIGKKWVVLAEFWVELQLDERGRLEGARASSKKLPSWVLREIESPTAWPPADLTDSLEIKEVDREELTFLQRLLQKAESAERLPTEVRREELSRQPSPFLPRGFWSWMTSLFPWARNSLL